MARYFSRSHGKNSTQNSVDSIPDSTPPIVANGTDQSINPEIIPDSPSVIPEAQFGRINGSYASADSSPKVDWIYGKFASEQLPPMQLRASDSFSQIRPLLSRSLQVPPVPAVQNSSITGSCLPIWPDAESSLDQPGIMMNCPGWTPDWSPRPGSWNFGSRTPVQPGS